MGFYITKIITYLLAKYPIEVFAILLLDKSDKGEVTKGAGGETLLAKAFVIWQKPLLFIWQAKLFTVDEMPWKVLMIIPVHLESPKY